MSEYNPQNSSRAPDEDREAGEPIGILRELEQDTSPSFLSMIRKRIYRRTTASQLISVSWHLPGVVFAELLNMFIHILGVRSIRKRD